MFCRFACFALIIVYSSFLVAMAAVKSLHGSCVAACSMLLLFPLF